MPKRKKNINESYDDQDARHIHRSSRTVEGRESQMIALAIDRVEERMLNGTASAQEYVHYLRLGANREKQKLENEKLRLETELVRAKTEALQSAKKNEELFEKAIRYMTVYQGRGTFDDYEDEDIF